MQKDHNGARVVTPLACLRRYNDDDDAGKDEPVTRAGLAPDEQVMFSDVARAVTETAGPGLMQPAHFYHAYADAAWRVPAEEHLQALTGFPGACYLGVVGAPGRRAAVAATLRWPVVAEADSGYEQVTLRALHTWAAGQPPQRPVLYAHTKAATHDEAAYGHWWRRAMAHYCAARWLACVDALASGYDAVGCHWLAPGFFAGNFWWATAGYLASLSPVPGESRYDAESWIGTGCPRVLDLNPGPPEPVRWGIRWDFTQRRLVQELLLLSIARAKP